MVNWQTIAIIFIVIIAIVLTIYFTFEVFDIPPPVNTQFADGTIVRIRSLANNKYLQVISCTGEFSNCTNSNFRAACSITDPVTNVLAATGETPDDASEFTVAQLKQTNPRVGGIQGGPNTDSAAYMLYLDKNTGDNSIRFDTISNVEGVYVTSNNLPTGGGNFIEGNSFFWKNLPAQCFCNLAPRPPGPNDPPNPIFNQCNQSSFLVPVGAKIVMLFTLIEESRSVNPNKIPSGSYFIQDFCNPTNYMFNPATITAPGCPPIITIAPNPPAPAESKLTQYAFSVERL